MSYRTSNGAAENRRDEYLMKRTLHRRRQGNMRRHEGLRASRYPRLTEITTMSSHQNDGVLPELAKSRLRTACELARLLGSGRGMLRVRRMRG